MELNKVKNPRLRSYIITFINSSINLWLAFVIIFSINQISAIISAKFFSIPTGFVFYKIDFIIPDHSPLWNISSILFLNFVPPFISLIIGVIAVRFYFLFKRKTGQKKLFFLWASVHAFNHFFGAYIAGFFTNKGFGYVPMWLFIPHGFHIVIAVVCAVLLLLLGFVTNLFFVACAKSHSFFKKKIIQLKFKTALIYLPLLCFISASYLLNIPDKSAYERIMYATLFLVFLPTFIPINSQRVNLVREKNTQNISLKIIILFIIFASIYFIFSYLFAVKH